MTTFAIHTLGCKVNTYESEGYIEGLKGYGFTQVDFKEKADIYIINTCAVTNTAASKSKQKIHAAKRSNPEALICVVGCLAQTAAEELNVDIVIGSSGKKELPMRIAQYLQSKEKKNYVEDVSRLSVFESLPIHSFSAHTRAFLKVQDGCNQFCSYCIIPFARGRERSLPLNEAISTAKALVEHGHKEIVLSGIHTGRYGNDIGSSLYELVASLCAIDGLERIRISSIEMNEITDEFISLMKEQSKIARHLHIPIQSGCDRTLKMMNRPYRMEEFKQRVSYIKEQLPGISISTDIILGFPDEQENDFLETMHSLEEIQFSFMHVFPFSKRDGTRACQIPNHLTNAEKKNRCQKVSLLSKKQYNEYKSTFVGKNVNVLFEYEKDGYMFGHTSEYLPVMAKQGRENINKMCTIQVDCVKDGILYSE